MSFAFARQLTIGVVVSLVALAYVQVSSVPPSATARSSHDWSSIAGDTTSDIHNAVSGVRAEVAWWRATYVRLSTDTRELDRRLSVENIENSGR